MKIFLLILFLSLQLSGFCRDAAPTPEGAEKKKNGNDTVYDFGEVIEGKKLEHTFTFKNSTQTVIEILKIRVPCGCAETKVDKTSLAPGEIAKFNVSPSTKGRRGKFSKNLYLLTDSKKFRIVKYTIKAKIEPAAAPLCSAPSLLKAGTMFPNAKKKISFAIKNNGALDLVIEQGVIASSVKLETKLPVTIQAGKKQTIELVLTAPFYEGKFRTNMMFKTNDKTRQNLWILLTANVVK